MSFQTIGGSAYSPSSALTVCGYGNCRSNAIHNKKYCYEHRGLESESTDTDVKVTHLTAKGDTQATANERSPFEQRLHRMVRRNPELVYQVAEKAMEAGDGRLSKNGWKRVQRAVDEVRFVQAQMQSVEKPIGSFREATSGRSPAADSAPPRPGRA